VRRISLIGPTGVGKSTLARRVAERFDGVVIKIAEPLYRLQEEFYRRIGKMVRGQDGELLQFLGHKVEKESPGWLATQFLDQVERSQTSLVVNDDCRLNSYKHLQANGFVFVRVHCEDTIHHARLRADHTSADPNHEVEKGFDEFDTLFTVDNSGSIDDSLRQINDSWFLIAEQFSK